MHKTVVIIILIFLGVQNGAFAILKKGVSLKKRSF
ncbi:MAG: hypothetical protein RL329_2300 [Bacteroidota bacterium]|jgi:uncharacterized membrane protein